MDLPVYKGVINENEDSGVSAVALVDIPAITRNFLAFKDEKKFEFSITNADRRIVSGPLMVADMPIYRKDGFKEYYIVFDKETIESIALRFFKNQNTRNVNLMHQGAYQEGVFMFESMIVDSSRGSTPPAYAEGISEGSWVGSFKVNNDEVWEKIKSGELRGFSVEGFFGQVHVADTEEAELEGLHDDLANFNSIITQLTQHPVLSKNTQ